MSSTTALVHGVVSSRGRPLDAAFTHVLRIAGNRIVGWLQVTDTAAWHEALRPQ